MKVITHVVKEYEVTDNFGETHIFKTEAEAILLEDIYEREKKVINYLRPRGITIVVNKNPNIFYQVFPAFVGYNGVPYAELSYEKEREHFMLCLDPIDHIYAFGGNLLQMLKECYRRIPNIPEGKRWNLKYGCNITHMLHPDHWEGIIYWYNWDGCQFTTNDPSCKITTEDFIPKLSESTKLRNRDC